MVTAVLGPALRRWRMIAGSLCLGLAVGGRPTLAVGGACRRRGCFWELKRRSGTYRIRANRRNPQAPGVRVGSIRPVCATARLVQPRAVSGDSQTSASGTSLRASIRPTRPSTESHLDSAGPFHVSAASGAHRADVSARVPPDRGKRSVRASERLRRSKSHAARGADGRCLHHDADHAAAAWDSTHVVATAAAASAGRWWLRPGSSSWVSPLRRWCLGRCSVPPSGMRSTSCRSS